MKKPTVTIGIPAYNEEANIKVLLKSLLGQSQVHCKIIEIIVVSDGCSDATVKKVKGIRNKKIKLLVFPKRKGVNMAQNKILKQAKGNILVMLNADVLPAHKDFIEEIINPILRDKRIGLVGGNSFTVPPTTHLERFLGNSHQLKQYMFKRIKNGNNLYMCNGKARAFSREFYSRLSWSDNCPEDAYSYLSCITMGYIFAFAHDAYIKFRCPNNLKDHIKQSNRFIYGKKKLEELFPSELLNREYKIPFPILSKALIKFMITRPFSTLAYLILNIIVRLHYKVEPLHHSKYDAVLSSKRISI